jgi:copper chaperone
MTSTTYHVTGMTCGHCAKAVSEEVTGSDGVTDVSVDVEAGTVVVTGEGVTEDAVRTAVDEAGYALA